MAGTASISESFASDWGRSQSFDSDWGKTLRALLVTIGQISEGFSNDWGRSLRALQVRGQVTELCKWLHGAGHENFAS